MERQSGLGRSLGDVIESLTPVDSELVSRVQLDTAELIQRLDDLLADVRELRDRVHELAAMVDGVEQPEPDGERKKPKAKKDKKKAKGRKK